MKRFCLALLLICALLLGGCATQKILPTELAPTEAALETEAKEFWNLPQITLLPTQEETGEYATEAIRRNPASLRPADGIWALGGNQVYFGRYDDQPMLFRVLAPSEGQTVEDSLFLDCGQVILHKAFDDNFWRNDGQDQPNEWRGSDLELLFNGEEFYGSDAVFSSPERNAIAKTSLKESAGSYVRNGKTYTDVAASDYVFLLSSQEADALYVENADRAKDGSSICYWLRSYFEFGGNGMGSIHGDGHLCSNSISNFAIGASPAMNVRLTSILFVSAAETDKTGDLTNVPEGSGDLWKLTLLDLSKFVAIPGSQQVTRTNTAQGVTITVPYVCIGEISQISVVILDRSVQDKNAQVLYYGALEGGASGKGVGSFVLPAELEDQVSREDYFVYLLAEEVRGSQESDFASGFFPVLIPAC